MSVSEFDIPGHGKAARTMVIGKLQPLEFTDCLLDSPEFRENLNQHEKELEKTSQQIKRIIKEVKDLLAAAKSEYRLGFLTLFTPKLPYKNDSNCVNYQCDSDDPLSGGTLV